MTNPRPLFALAVALCAVGLVVTAAEVPESESVASDAPVHLDARALENATLEAERATLRDDVEALVPALEEVSKLTRRLEKGAAGRYEPIRGVDRGFHVALDAAIEAARNGDLQGAVSQTHWVTVGCRKCHVEARLNDLLANTPLLQAD
jgi:hypothetical protein